MYILTFVYGDRSAFKICGITENRIVAETWYNANDENDIYYADAAKAPTNWDQGIESWRQQKKKST